MLDGNAFKAWADVAACAGFTSLQRLSLSENVLADVQGPQPGRGLLQHALPACLLVSWLVMPCRLAIKAIRPSCVS